MSNNPKLGTLCATGNGFEMWTDLGWIPVDAGEITAEKFRLATGQWPEHDDLDRCNCPKAGELGHFHCGWNHDQNVPQFMARAED